MLSVTMSSDQQGELCAINAEDNGRALCTVTLDPGQHLLLFTVRNSAEYEATASTYFDVVALVDIDNDGDGFSENQGDCDDENPTTAPGATELPNNVDDNCDGRIDEGTTRYDDDGDGFTEEQGDCDDANFQLNPAATEVCGDGVDSSCNNTQNELNADSCTTFYRDADGDGYGDPFSECWCSAGGSTGEYTETNDSDCYDGNPDANITQSGYFGVDRGDGSFDYNCDSSDEQGLRVIGSCSSPGIQCGRLHLRCRGVGKQCSCLWSIQWLHYDNDSCSAGCRAFGIPFCCEVGGPSYKCPGFKTVVRQQSPQSVCLVVGVRPLFCLPSEINLCYTVESREVNVLLGLLACVGGSDVKVGVYNTPPSASIVFPTEGSAFDRR